MRKINSREATDGDGRRGCDGEVLDVPVLHAGVDGDDADVALVAETDDGDHREHVQPVVGPRLDGAENRNNYCTSLLDWVGGAKYPGLECP